MVRKALLLALFLAGTARATTFNFGTVNISRAGVLAAAQTGNGVSASTVQCDGATAMDVTYLISGTVTNVTMEKSIDGLAGTYYTVTDNSGPHTSSADITIPRPSGVYESRVAGCSSCNVTVKFYCVWDGSAPR